MGLSESCEVEQAVDREFSESGLGKVLDLAVDRFAEAMRLYDEAAKVPKWDTAKTQSLQYPASRLVTDVTLIGLVLDNVVPLSGDLHWFDQIQAEASIRLSGEGS